MNNAVTGVLLVLVGLFMMFEGGTTDFLLIVVGLILLILGVMIMGRRTQAPRSIES